MTKIDYFGNDAVFIVGCPRSGTTWLQKMIASHPDVESGTESDLFSQFIGPLVKNWQLQCIPTGRGLMGLPTYISEDKFIEYVRNFVGRLLRDMKRDKTIFLDKTPQHALYLNEIHTILPQAKIIHIVRDPRDVCLSIIRASKSWSSIGATTIPKAAKVWRKHILAVKNSQEIFPDNQFYSLKFENLVNNPACELGKLFRWLTLRCDEALVNKAVNENCLPRARENSDYRFELRGKYSGLSKEPAGFINTGRPGSWRQSFHLLDRLFLNLVMKKEINLYQCL